MALKARVPMQVIQALSISNVNTRRMSKVTEHLARQRIAIERISEAKKVYEEEEFSLLFEGLIDRVCTYGRQRTLPAIGHLASDVISSDLARPFLSPWNTTADCI